MINATHKKNTKRVEKISQKNKCNLLNNPTLNSKRITAKIKILNKLTKNKVKDQIKNIFNPSLNLISFVNKIKIDNKI